MSAETSLKIVPRLTPEEYLVIERAAEFRSEYIDGEMFEMAGGSGNHSLIVFNLVGELGGQLRGTGCRGYAVDLRVQVIPGGLYTYPDLVVVRGESRFRDSEEDTLLNPTLIVEVLSPSTEAWDRGGKFERYRSLPSLQEYVLISQDRPRVERFLRADEGPWPVLETVGLDQEVRLAAIGCTLHLAEIYEGVSFRSVDRE